MSGETSSMNTLEAAVASNNDPNIIKYLTQILAESKHIVFKNVSILKTLLKSQNKDVLKLVAQAIAESAKTLDQRKQLTDSDLIKLLLQQLDQTDTVLLIQVCRALGNLCYENDTARQYVTESNGLKRLLTIIELCLNTKNANAQLLNIVCGFLLNYLMLNERAIKSALNSNTLGLIEEIIKNKLNDFNTNEELFTHLLLVLNVLSENLIDSWFSNELCLHVMKILELSTNPEISELCLDLLHTQGENDEIKLILAKGGICELLFNLLEEHKALVQDEEGRALMKLACDLIVLMLTGDESMSLLYSGGNGKVYKNMLIWLESDDIDLLITGVLTMGNFARNDVHCIQMVQNGLSEILLDLLSKHNKPNGEIRLQHALLSALRNLVIPAENKNRILKNGLVEKILPLLATEQQPVVFKLLGTLRMVLDGQEQTALQLIKNVDLLKKLVDWCLNSDHPGVRAESPRLLAWLIKHCHSSEPIANLTNVPDSIRCLVEMIPSSHTVMQNEALLALNLITACFKDTKPSSTTNIDQILINADVGKYIAFLLNKYGDKIEKEVLLNLLTLLELMILYQNVKTHLKSTQVPESFQKCLNRENLKPLYDRINKIIADINSG